MGVQNSTKKRSDSGKSFESNAHLSMCLSTTDYKESLLVYFSLNRNHRYQGNLAGAGTDSGEVSIFAEGLESGAIEREGRAGVVPPK